MYVSNRPLFDNRSRPFVGGINAELGVSLPFYLRPGTRGIHLELDRVGTSENIALSWEIQSRLGLSAGGGWYTLTDGAIMAALPGVGIGLPGYSDVLYHWYEADAAREARLAAFATVARRQELYGELRIRITIDSVASVGVECVVTAQELI